MRFYAILAAAFVAVCSFDTSHAQQSAIAGQFPHQGYVSDLEGNYIHGCWIYNRNWVVASHQWLVRTANNTLVNVNTINIGEGIQHRVQQIVRHPDHTDITYEYNLSLLQIQGFFYWTANVRPFPLLREIVGTGVVVTTAGFNMLQEDRPTDYMTYYTTVTISNEDCAARVEPENQSRVTDQIICIEAGPYCNGYTGNSLIGMGVIVGSKSLGYDCTEYPAMYLRMSYFADWIEEHAGIAG